MIKSKSESLGKVAQIIAQAELDVSKLLGYRICFDWKPFAEANSEERRQRLFETIITTVCDVLGQPTQAATLRSRRREYAMARQIIAYLALRTYRVASDKQIGLRLGGRDRSTIIWAADTAQDLIDSDRFFRQTVELCKAEVDILLQLGNP